MLFIRELQTSNSPTIRGITQGYTFQSRPVADARKTHSAGSGYHGDCNSAIAVASTKGVIDREKAVLVNRNIP